MPQLVELLGIDPRAEAAISRAPMVEVEAMDSRWRVDRDLITFASDDESAQGDIQPTGVDLSITSGTVTFQLTQALDDISATHLTTGHRTDIDPADGTAQPVASGPYTLADSHLIWENAEFPTEWGGPGDVVARVRLRGDTETDDLNAIDVLFTDSQIKVAHTEASVETVDFTADLFPVAVTAFPVAGDTTVTPFRWVRIEANPTGTVFTVRASRDGIFWVVLVSRTMGADLAGAFLQSTVQFTLTSSGTDAAGRWVIGSVNELPVSNNFAGVYTVSEDQGGFGYTGLWYQFGYPLDGVRADYVYHTADGDWYDADGNVHYQWVSALCYAADDPNMAYAVVVDKVFLFLSQDGGLTWGQKRMPFREAVPLRPLDPNAGVGEVFDIASPRTGEILIFFRKSPNLPSLSGIWRSTDDGTTWTRVAVTIEEQGGVGLILNSGGMQISPAKVWWAEEAAQQNQIISGPITGPSYHVVSSSVLPWLVTINDKPANGPFLDVSGSGLSSFEIPGGPVPPGSPPGTPPPVATMGTASFTVISGATPGIWYAGRVPSAVIWEATLPNPWAGETIAGTYAPIGLSIATMPTLLWQPGAIPDATVDEYWALTDNMAERLHSLKLALMVPPAGAMPPDLPDLGGGGPGWWVGLNEYNSTLFQDIGEPMNSGAGVVIVSREMRREHFVTDFMETVSPHYPGSVASVWQQVIRGPGPNGAKLRVVNYDDVILEFHRNDPHINTERKASYTMSGCLSAVVFDMDAADLATWGPSAFQGLPPVKTLNTVAVGGGTWQVTSGEPGYLLTATATIGPSWAQKTLPYAKFEHPTYIYTDFPGVTSGYTFHIDPNPYGDPNLGGGLLVATITAFGTEAPIPPGWTVVPDSSVTSESVDFAAIGTDPLSEPGRTSWRPGSGAYIFYETGQWFATPTGGQTIVREYKFGENRTNLTSMSQVVVTHAIDWNSPIVPLALPSADASTQIWASILSVGILRLPPVSTQSQTLSTTWSVKRANFDGTTQEVVGSIGFSAPAIGPTGPYPFRLQVRAFNDALALVSSYAGNCIYRVRSTDGAVNIWPATALEERVWDAIALDETTFLAVVSTGYLPDGTLPPGVPQHTARVYRSVNAGSSWQLTRTFTPEESFARYGAADSYQMVAAINNDPQRVALLGNAAYNQQQIIWMSGDGGLTWEPNLNTSDPVDAAGEYMIYGPGGLLATPKTSGAAAKLQEYTVRTIAFGVNPLTGQLWVANDFNVLGAEHGVRSI